MPGKVRQVWLREVIFVGERRVLFPVREEAKEAKRRRLTPVGFDAQRGKSSSEAQLQMRHYVARSLSRAAAVPGSAGRVDVPVALPAHSQPLPHKSPCYHDLLVGVCVLYLRGLEGVVESLALLPSERLIPSERDLTRGAPRDSRSNAGPCAA